ncbi:MAG: hypothetical protein WKF35_03305 [Ferruginibacter sp.]
MQQLYVYLASAFGAGFVIAWVLRTISIASIKKSNKSLAGFLESEKLIKETLNKENKVFQYRTDKVLDEYEFKIRELEKNIRQMDGDILLLQKNNEETEALLESGLPVVHSLKLQLIEAHNTIARYKAQLEQPVVSK